MENLLQQRQMLLVWLGACTEDKEEKAERLEKQIDKIDNLLEDYFKNKTIKFETIKALKGEKILQNNK